MANAINLDKLREAYSDKYQVVIYTGAGVSTSPQKLIEGKRYGIPLWIPLLEQISELRDINDWPKLTNRIPIPNIKEDDKDPFTVVHETIKKCGGKEEFFFRLKEIIKWDDNYIDSNGQLCSTFISNAPTLNAVSSFCGRLDGRVFDKDNPEPDRITFHSTLNNRIRAVLTTNYDCFLESAASNMYRKSPLKPVTAKGSRAGHIKRIPVFHIHGYIHHPKFQRSSTKERELTIKDLVITRDEYEKQWNPKDVFGITMGPQIHYLRYFTVIFIGFSFEDKYVCNLLRQINKDYLKSAKRTHLALVSQKEVDSKPDSFYDEMGITPVIYTNHKDIPDLLFKVYRAGLQKDNELTNSSSDCVILPQLKNRIHTPTGKNYKYSHEGIWDIMMSCRNESVSKGKVNKYNCKIS